MPKPRIAIVHDWLNTLGGDVRVIEAFHEAFPEAPIYTSVYDPSVLPQFKKTAIHTTWLQRFPPFLRRFHKFFPMLRVWAFRSLDLKDYDILLVSSSAESKQIKKLPHQKIICYCHTPIRYYWSHYAEYKKDPGFGSLNWLIRLAMPVMVPPLKKVDYQAAQRVDTFIANSSEVQQRIQQYYNKPSTVVHPPVDIERFSASALNKDRKGYIVVGRQVPYKRVDLAVAACTKLGLPLTIYGQGSEHQRLKAMAGPTITFIVGASDKEVATAFGKAKGFIFTAEEDFGIVQVESLAAGTPVIAYGKGGSLDIVQEGETGIFFPEQTVESLVQTLQTFEGMSFLPATLHRRSKRFAKSLFISKIRKIVGDHIEQKGEQL